MRALAVPFVRALAVPFVRTLPVPCEGHWLYLYFKDDTAFGTCTIEVPVCFEPPNPGALGV